MVVEELGDDFEHAREHEIVDSLTGHSQNDTETGRRDDIEKDEDPDESDVGPHVFPVMPLRPQRIHLLSISSPRFRGSCHVANRRYSQIGLRPEFAARLLRDTVIREVIELVTKK